MSIDQILYDIDLQRGDRRKFNRENISDLQALFPPSCATSHHELDKFAQIEDFMAKADNFMSMKKFE